MPLHLCSRLTSLWSRTQRTKSTSVSSDDLMATALRRCLSTTDIVLLGIGHMVGSGAYVITSTVAKNVAGPAIALSYVLSGLAAFLCALCYAEFSGRFPKCGSAYSYTYIALGELWAFVVGWNMILENVIGIAAVSRAVSAYLDSTIGGEIKNATNSVLAPVLGGGHSELTSHMDLLSGLIAIATALFLTAGMRVTTVVNNVFSLVNIAAILIIITVGGYFANLANWTAVPGGFMPFGWKGVFAGSASCFYAFIGFDSIATSGEEAKDPQKSIPIATFISMAFATFSYVGVSVVLTLMLPYTAIDDESGLPMALGAHGATWAKMAVIVGACCGMATVLIGTIYSLTRIVYAMSEDGLLFPWMGEVNAKTAIPLKAMFAFTSLGMWLGVFVDMTTLVEFMSIGTLIAYTTVSASIIVVRYQKSPSAGEGGGHHGTAATGTSAAASVLAANIEADEAAAAAAAASGAEDAGEEEKLLQQSEHLSSGPSTSIRSAFADVVNSKVLLSSLDRFFHDSLISVAVFLIVLLTVLLCLTCKLFNKGVDDKLVAFLLSLLATFLILVVWIVAKHEQNGEPLRYKVPFVPFLPVLSILFNVALIVNLNWLTWMRFIVWMVIGFTIYFAYGIKHSKAQYGSELSININTNKADIKNWGSMDVSDANEDEVSVMTQ